LTKYWGLGIGDWGLGIGDWPNPQSPLNEKNCIINDWAHYNIYLR